jgi:DNA-binding IclR family transcriptional regulator
VGVLDKAVAVLDALEFGPLSLNDLADATGLNRATIHRLGCALAVHGLAARDGGGRFLLGPRMVGRALELAARPPLERLRDATGESTQLYVRRGKSRVCLLSLESPHGLRTIVPAGAVLPLDAGSAGRVLADKTLAGWAESAEEREKGVASVSAGVLRAGQVVAAVSVSGPIERTGRQPSRRYLDAVQQAAREVEEAMGWA